MLFDLLFLGYPMLIGIVLAGVAIRDEEPKFWPPAICIAAYCLFYVFGGREVILYLACAAIGGAMII